MGNFGLRILIVMMIWIAVSNYIDYKKKRKPHTNPSISIIIPCYNDGHTIQETIHSVYKSYDNDKIELIIVNDKSKDNSREKILELQPKYNFIFKENEHNKGKSKTLNDTADICTNDIIMILDADTHLSHKALNDLLQRLEEPKVAAVSCAYKPSNKGFLPSLQYVEYNMTKFTIGSYNLTSAMLLRGGCIAMKKKPFFEAEKFSINSIAEDMDLAMKLNKLGYKVQQGTYQVASEVPDTIRSFFKQRMRRSSGNMQCLLKFPEVWIKNPLFIIFASILSGSISFGTMYFLKNSFLFGNFIEFCFTLFQITTFQNGLSALSILYGDNVVAVTIRSLGFTLFALPYTIPTIKTTRQFRKIIRVIPYTLIYTPGYSIIWIAGTLLGIKKYYELKPHKDMKAW